MAAAWFCLRDEGKKDVLRYVFRVLCGSRQGFGGGKRAGASEMANGLEKEILFSDEELREMSGVKRGGDYIEVTCGCTSHRYGDAVDKLTPAAFEKHSGRETARKRKNNVWVIVNGEKVPLSKTVLLKYYSQASKNANGSHRSCNGRVCHRDEFVCCSKCKKERRFRLRTKEECRIHHDALADVNWKCADLPFDKKMQIHCFEISESHATMKKNAQVVGYTEAAPGPQHAKVALPACALGVKSVVSQIAVARLASTSQGMQKLKSNDAFSTDEDITLFLVVLLWSSFTSI
ncbi:hypothetical protein GH714_004409 [Hevea brasiliensis]|uniref:SAND domain-containing protein n=1 Tax=Hevea brasiliensis TaxID=3981 RepID=A0A6A6NFS2_HEVBR|nr:hypothetical protein GH714_004409 [Hevea brasiliensis]